MINKLIDIKIFISFILLIYIEVHLLRIFIIDSRYLSVLLLFSICLVPAVNFFKNKPKLFFLHFEFYLFFTFLLFLLILNLIFNINNLTIGEIYIFYFLPFFSIIFYWLLNLYKLEKNLFKLFVIVFVIQSSYLSVELFDQYLGFNIHKSNKIIDFYFHTYIGRFEGSDGGWGHNIVFNFYKSLPLLLGTKGWPHYTAPIYLISFIGSLIYFISKKKSLDFNLLIFLHLIIGLFFILMLNVKTHWFSCIISLILITFFLNKRLIIFIFVMLVILLLATYNNEFLNDRILGSFKNFFSQVHYTFSSNTFLQRGRFDEIFDFQQFNIFTKITFDRLLFGFGLKANQISQNFGNIQISLIEIALKLGIPYIIFYVSLNLYSVYILISLLIKEKEYKAKKIILFLLCSIIILFSDSIHFGQNFTEPLYGLNYIFIGYTFYLKKNTCNYTFEKIHLLVNNKYR